MPYAPPLRRNLEIKAKLRSLEIARQQAERIATGYLGVQWQADTYFRCTHGRLKLREIEADGQTQSQLIWYLRPDQQSFKQSQYTLVPVPDGALLKQTLAAGLGVRQVVSKRREIFLYENVRIHLDDVARLGAFLEFEAVIHTPADEAVSPARLAQLVQHFAILPEDLQRASYADLLPAQD